MVECAELIPDARATDFAVDRKSISKGLEMHRALLATWIATATLFMASNAPAQELRFADQRQQQPASIGTPSRPLPTRPETSAIDSLENASSRGAGSSWGTLVALAVVVGLILVTAKFWRRFAPTASQSLPPDVVRILGKKPLDSRHSLTLVKCGSRVLVLGFSPHGMHTLTEITEAAEVDLLAGLCTVPSSGTPGAATFGDFWKRAPEQTNSAVDSAPYESPQMERYADSHA